ncbi:hypothetical protein PTSG_03156 [Salpingoeca rosetta]|uniref:DUF5614 domain-containing protein n=1 Tax=Salpingoeca rosetta (strain ATCC 50818 / BSB-021) TaxID=946362 RepID=F2U4E1_SALR5|nr:uncharacterized protein PTSG_03156 [Salpingoeca rosetta]EGD82507.1 hypothetical protein PTSG_03156 [Salpingoeca rosetta]|eukprot:XP_004995743.1 hypothetical protein PTSG_03156 [Salpingoeca rosetta]
MEEAERQRLEACASEMVKAIETGFPTDVEGIDKLKKRVGAELEFLQGLRGAFDDSSSSSSSSSSQDGDLCQLQQHETEAKNEGKKNEEEQRRTQRRQLAAAKLASTNLPHLQQIVAYVQDHRDAVTAVFHKVRVRSRNGVLGGVVDIVADGGRSWFKVTARKAIALQLIWEGRASFKKKSIVDQIMVAKMW